MFETILVINLDRRQDLWQTNIVTLIEYFKSNKMNKHLSL